SEWPDASRNAVQQGDVRIRVTDWQFQADQLLIRLQVENTGNAGGVRFRPWGVAAGGQAPRLTDESDRTYRHALTTADPTTTDGQGLQPGQPVNITLVFQGEFRIEALHLELPASAFKGYGRLRLLLPKAMTAVKLAPTLESKAVPALVEALQDK